MGQKECIDNWCQKMRLGKIFSLSAFRVKTFAVQRGSNFVSDDEAIMYNLTDM